MKIKDVAKRYLDRARLLTTALLPAESVGAAGSPKADDLLRRAVARGARSIPCATFRPSSSTGTGTSRAFDATSAF